MDAERKQEKLDSASPSIGEEVIRQIAEFTPSVWDDFFINYPPSIPNLEAEQKVKELKEEVKTMFLSSDLVKKLRLIDDLQRLGIDYHFEEEIGEALSCIRNDEVMNDDMIDDIYLVSLRFRLLRQQGYNVSSDVFSKFKDSTEGKFKQELSCDAKGLMQLYEAAWLHTHEDSILDEALDFSRGHMERMLNDDATNRHVAQMTHALDTPFHRGARRLEAKKYIPIYQKDEAHNRLLLELAKLDFDLVQSLHIDEVKSISVWWKELGLAENLNFGRNRIVEGYFWCLIFCVEPRYSSCRKLLTKFFQLGTLLDDMYDSYGTFHELQQFKDAIDRWDFQYLDHLPMYMRILLRSLASYFSEVEDEMTRNGNAHHMHYIKELFKPYIAAYFEEAQWRKSGYKPTLEEYIQVRLVSIGNAIFVCLALCLMGEITDYSLDWFLSMPKILVAASTLVGLRNDLSLYKDEQQRLDVVVSAVQCFMNDTGEEMQRAIAKVKEIVANSWKDVNKECLDTQSFKVPVNLYILNFCSTTEVIYNYKQGDSFTHPKGYMNDNICKLLVRSNWD